MLFSHSIDDVRCTEGPSECILLSSVGLSNYCVLFARGLRSLSFLRIVLHFSIFGLRPHLRSAHPLSSLVGSILGLGQQGRSGRLSIFVIPRVCSLHIS
jgi:hypothetical protein